MTLLPSIHDAVQVEAGAKAARDGFAYQDEVAVHLLLKMLADAQIAELRCESEDDITVIWEHAGQEIVEFIQVKSEDHPRLWSVADITRPVRGSLVEASMSRDAIREPARFCFVTRTSVQPELRPLRRSPGTPPPDPGTRSIGSIKADLIRNLGTAASKQCADAGEWCERASWIEFAQVEDVVNANRALLDEVLASRVVLQPHREKLLERLRSMVFRAAKAKPGPEKILRRDTMRARFERELAELTGPTSTQDTLLAKMTVAGIGLTEQRSALDLRAKYRMARRAPASYMDEPEWKQLEPNVLGKLAVLRACFRTDAPADFYVRCVRELSAPNDPSVGLRLGAMFEATGRCSHEFALQ